MLKPGDRFGDYTVIRLLGKGGMGAVYLLETADGAQVAAKILDPETAGDHESRKRFVREAELALGVKHPNLVETYDVGEDPDTGLCYILMEYVPGGSLADRLRQGPLPINEAIGVVYQIASVLELARQKGIVHRDIKPANIMFGADGKAKLADLGIARGGLGGTNTTTVTQTGMMIGTPAYMAPEQMLDAHHVDSRADIYSLGIVFYEMLAGQRPHPDDTVVQLMAKAVAGEPVPDVRTMRPEVSASLAELVSLMCAMKADERVATPTEVTTALSQIVHGHEVTVRRKAPKAVAERQPLSGKVLVPIGVLAGLLAVIVVLAPKHEQPRPQRPADSPEPTVRTVVQTVVRTNVVEKIVEKPVVRTVEKTPVQALPKADDARPPYVLKPISTLGPNTQQRLKDMGSRRRSGQRRGVMVFGTLRIDGRFSGRDVASWAWLGDNGWFSADIWPNDHGENGGAYVKGGRRLLFLKHGYEPLELDLSREADREWSDSEAYDLGQLELKRLSEDRQCTVTVPVNLPSGVPEADLRLFLDNRKICGYDWGTSSRLQRPKVEVLRRRVRSGELVRIDGCTPTDYELEIRADGCVRFQKRIDVSDATARNLKGVSLQRVRRATFALRTFVGGAWSVKSVLADGVQQLRFEDGPSRHVLRLDPYEQDRGLTVSSFYQPSAYDDYGELTTNMIDRQVLSGTLAAPVSLAPRAGKVCFYPGRIYRFRNSHQPIDVLIAFLDYRDVTPDDDRPSAERLFERAKQEANRIAGYAKNAGGLVEKAKDVVGAVSEKIREANRDLSAHKDAREGFDWDGHFDYNAPKGMELSEALLKRTDGALSAVEEKVKRLKSAREEIKTVVGEIALAKTQFSAGKEVKRLERLILDFQKLKVAPTGRFRLKRWEEQNEIVKVASDRVKLLEWLLYVSVEDGPAHDHLVKALKAARREEKVQGDKLLKLKRW